MIRFTNYKFAFWLICCQLNFIVGISYLSAQNTTQEKAIHTAYTQDKISGTQTQLEKLNRELDVAFKTIDNPFNRYWLSYGLYNQALLAGIQEDENKAESLVDRSIELLNPLRKDAESLALLSLAQGYSTQFKGYFALMRIGRNAVLNAQQAAVLNPKSLRANLAVAINDFYTPKTFGGGKLTLEYLNNAMKATTLKPQDSLPNWGKPNVYELLVKYYRKNKQFNIAQDYLNQGLEEFPASELLQGLK